MRHTLITDFLKGHPLTIQLCASQLEFKSLSELYEEINNNFGCISSQDSKRREFCLDTSIETSFKYA